MCLTYLSGLRVLLVLGVADGAVLLDDHGPTTSAFAQVPAVLLGELGVGITEQELSEGVSACYAHLSSHCTYEVLALRNLENLAPAIPVLQVRSVRV